MLARERDVVECRTSVRPSRLPEHANRLLRGIARHVADAHGNVDAVKVAQACRVPSILHTLRTVYSRNLPDLVDREDIADEVILLSYKDLVNDCAQHSRELRCISKLREAATLEGIPGLRETASLCHRLAARLFASMAGYRTSLLAGFAHTSSPGARVPDYLYRSNDGIVSGELLAFVSAAAASHLLQADESWAKVLEVLDDDSCTKSKAVTRTHAILADALLKLSQTSSDKFFLEPAMTQRGLFSLRSQLDSDAPRDMSMRESFCQFCAELLAADSPAAGFGTLSLVLDSFGTHVVTALMEATVRPSDGHLLVIGSAFANRFDDLRVALQTRLTLLDPRDPSVRNSSYYRCHNARVPQSATHMTSSRNGDDIAGAIGSFRHRSSQVRHGYEFIPRVAADVKDACSWHSMRRIACYFGNAGDAAALRHDVVELSGAEAASRHTSLLPAALVVLSCADVARYSSKDLDSLLRQVLNVITMDSGGSLKSEQTVRLLSRMWTPRTFQLHSMSSLAAVLSSRDFVREYSKQLTAARGAGLGDTAWNFDSRDMGTVLARFAALLDAQDTSPSTIDMRCNLHHTNAIFANLRLFLRELCGEMPQFQKCKRARAERSCQDLELGGIEQKLVARIERARESCVPTDMRAELDRNRRSLRNDWTRHYQGRYTSVGTAFSLFDEHDRVAYLTDPTRLL